METQFYAYLWLREDGTPYYAGKGRGRRAFRHQKPPYPPRDLTRILVFNRNSEREAIATEMEFIRNWGRKDIGTGCLLNLTDGGEGMSGHVATAEHRAKISLASKGNKSFLGHKHPPEWSAKMSANQTGENRPYRLGMSHTLETKKKISKSLEGNKYAVGYHHTPETKAKVSMMTKGKKKSPETRARMKTSWTPERRMQRAEETRQRMKELFLKTVAWG